MSYTKYFTPTYPSGWRGKPNTTTPIVASALNNYDATFQYIENFIHDLDPIGKTEADTRYIKNKSLSSTQYLSTTESTTYTFTDNAIDDFCTIDVYTSPININYIDMQIENGTCTVTYPKQDEAVQVTCKIYIK